MLLSGALVRQHPAQVAYPLMSHNSPAIQARLASLEARNRELETRAAQLEDEKRHYQWLAESTTDLISRHARDGTFLYASQAARDLLGYAPEELIGVSAYDLFHPIEDRKNTRLNSSHVR